MAKKELRPVLPLRDAIQAWLQCHGEGVTQHSQPQQAPAGVLRTGLTGLGMRSISSSPGGAVQPAAAPIPRSPLAPATPKTPPMASGEPAGPKQAAQAPAATGILSTTAALWAEKLRASKEAKWDGVELMNEDVAILAEALQLGAAGQELESLTLKESSLSFKSIQVLADVLRSGAVPLLLALDLSCNRLGARGMAVLAPALSNGSSRGGTLPALTTLVLADNGLGAKGMKELATVMIDGSFTTLEALDLTGNELGEKGAKELGAALSSGKMPALATLRLAGNKLGYAGMEALYSDEFYNSHIVTLDVGSNALTVESLTFVATSSLTAVDLSGNDELGTGAWSDLESSNFPCAKLKSLTLNSCGMNNVSMERLATAVDNLIDAEDGESLQLEVLRLGENDLEGSKGVASLCKLLKHCPTLEELDVSWNMGMGDEGMGELSDLLASYALHALKVLVLAYCGLKNKGVAMLAGALGNGAAPALTTLSLTGNCDVKDSGFAYRTEGLAEALYSGRLPALTTLDVSLKHVPGGSHSMNLGALKTAAEMGYMRKLQHLKGIDFFHEFGWMDVLQSGSLPALTSLCFNVSSIGDANTGLSIADVLTSGSMPHLRSLDLWVWGCDAVKAVANLLRSGKVPALASLRLWIADVPKVDADYKRYIDASPIVEALSADTAPAIVDLELHSGLALLARALQAGALPALKVLRVSESCEATVAMARAALRARPLCQVQLLRVYEYHEEVERNREIVLREMNRRSVTAEL
jgi:Ran GTPase-activating protein (RanGAP) involved in mRNA processing and transport